MRTLTTEDIKLNPNAVLSLPFPDSPSRYLLLLAQIAATCAREIASETIDEFESDYDSDKIPHPEMLRALKEWHRAHNKIGEICFLLQDEYDVPMFDFCLSRDQRKKSFIRKIQEFIERGLR
jgi:hypothetical protein